MTIAARVWHAGRNHRTAILDVSDGGLLLAPIAALLPTGSPSILIEAHALGTVRVRIVGISHIGVHTEIEEMPARYHATIRRLANLTQAWTQHGRAFAVPRA